MLVSDRGMVVMLILLTVSLEAGAGITSVGDIDPVYLGSDPWVVAGDLTVGWDTMGTLTVNQGSRVQSEYGFLGYDSTGHGTVTITGSGSRWDNTSELWVGSVGFGDLVVADQGQVITDDLLIAYDAEGWGAGQVGVTGVGSRLDVIDEFHVGYTGIGVLLVEQGAMATSGWATIGAWPGSAGLAQVTDAGSLWSVAGSLYVGGDDYGAGGTGILEIDQGAQVAADEVMVWFNGQVEGGGRLATSWLYNEGTLKPTGTLTIDGDLDMAPTGQLEVRVDNAGGSDLLRVTGDVTLSGGTVIPIAQETITQQHDYRILEGATVVGDLGAVDRRYMNIALTDPGIPDVWFGYTDDAAYLSIVALPYNDPWVARSSNQMSLGHALQGMSDRGGNQITQSLSLLNNLEQVRAAYDQLTGLQRAVLPVVTLEMVNALNRQLMSRTESLARKSPQGSVYQAKRGADKGSTSGGQGGVWAQAYGLYSQRQGEPVAFDYCLRGGGAILGVEGFLTDSWNVGLAGGVALAEVADGTDHATTEIDSQSVGLYSQVRWDSWRFEAAASYTHLGYRARRQVDLTGERLDSRFAGQALSVAGELGRAWDVQYGIRLEPVMGGQWARLHLDGATETGSIASLDYAAQDWTSLWGWIGGRVLGQVWDENYLQMDGELSLRWVHAFGSEPPQSRATFTQDTQADFTLQDKEMARDNLALGAQVELCASSHIRWLLRYDGLYSEDRASHAGSLKLLVQW